MVEKYKTSTPVDELRGIHNRMITDIKVEFSGDWDKEVRDDLEDMYTEMDKDEDNTLEGEK
jgi:hypothetical protein